MATLLPYDAKNITANWSSTAKQLIVTANAPLPAKFVAGAFKRQSVMGGRLFRLEGKADSVAFVQTIFPYAEDINEKPLFSAVHVDLLDPVTKKEFRAKIELTIDMPPPVVALVPQPISTLTPKSSSSALAAINIALPAQNFVRITAPVSDTRVTVEGRNEGDTSFTWRAGQLPGQMYWDVAWSGNGAGVAKGAVFTITTTTAKAALNGTQSAGATSQTVVLQPYAIKLPAVDEFRGPSVDLFDPNA